MPSPRTPRGEALYEILEISRATGYPATVLANALRQCVNSDLAQVAMAIASIHEHDGLDPRDDLTTNEAAAAHYAASVELAQAANDAICAHQIDELRPMQPPHPDHAPAAPMFHSVRAPQFQEAAE